MVSFTPRQLIPAERDPGRLGGPHTRYGRYGGEITFPLPGIKFPVGVILKLITHIYYQVKKGKTIPVTGREGP
jgi:hypothetical protein